MVIGVWFYFWKGLGRRILYFKVVKVIILGWNIYGNKIEFCGSLGERV